MRPDLKLVVSDKPRRIRKKKQEIKKIVDFAYPKVLQEPRARIYDNIALYTNLHESNNVQDILSCEKLAENLIEQSKLLLEEVRTKRFNMIKALGGQIG